jgi:hypothetical protein
MRLDQQRVRLDNQNHVTAIWAVPDTFRAGQTATVLLAHGAGSDMHHPFFHEILAKHGLLKGCNRSLETRIRRALGNASVVKKLVEEPHQ